MRDYTRFAAAAFVCAGAIAASVPAHAVTFATYTQVGTKTTIRWVLSGPSGTIFSTLPGQYAAKPTPVTFNFTDTTKYLSGMAAVLTLSGSETGNPATDSVDQGGIAGSFTFTYEGPTTTFMGKTYTHDVTNLLTGVFTLAHISGTATSGAFHDSTSIGTLAYTSDIFAGLPTALSADYSIALASIKPALGFTPGHGLNSFKAGASGIFSAILVPEPASWAVMLVGLAGLGVALRRRRSTLMA
jgi:hypothetical protein